MSEQKKVFPEFKKVGDCEVSEGGMTLEEFYKGVAMHALLSNPSIVNNLAQSKGRPVRELNLAACRYARDMIATQHCEEETKAFEEREKNAGQNQN